MRALRWPHIALFFTVVFLAPLLRATAAAPAGFQEANKLYEQGRYGDAISAYQSIVKEGRLSGAVLYNLGNAYFKNGELGRAIYNYRRAEALDPRDPDIQANLRFARDRVSGGSSSVPGAWHRLISYFTLNELASSAAVLFWILLLLLTLTRYRPAWRTTLRAYCGIAIALLAVNLILLTAAAGREPTAIAVAHQLTVHLGPLKESQPAFTVPDGTELRIENRREDWLQVSDRSGRTGWIQGAEVLTLP